MLKEVSVVLEGGQTREGEGEGEEQTGYRGESHILISGPNHQQKPE